MTTSEPVATRQGFFESTRVFLEMIKISHSIFALPFAIAAAFLAAGGLPSGLLIVKIVLACVCARTAAMSFNRWADADVDARNPRTAIRAIPAGLLSRKAVGLATLVSCALFVACAWWINPLAFKLSPVALAVLLGYSLTKRFTQMAHLGLGLALGLSPLGAWVAIRDELALLPAILGLAVLFWTAGFDIIYACQDVDFDRQQKLHSIPSRWGVARALWSSRFLHVINVALLVLVGVLAPLSWPYYVGVVFVTALLLYEHSIVRADDLSRVGVAFFTLNGIVSMVFMVATVVDILWRPV